MLESCALQMAAALVELEESGARLETRRMDKQQHGLKSYACILDIQLEPSVLDLTECDCNNVVGRTQSYNIALAKIVRLASDQLVMRERFDLARFDQHDIVRVLHFAFDQEKIFFGD